MSNIEELRERCKEMMAVSRMPYAHIPASSIITLIDRIEKAEAELSAAQQRIDELEIYQNEENAANRVLSSALSAANEKLKVPIKLPKKIYLKSSRGNVISWSKTFDAIEAAGFTVEGE
ncbi:hypothetical protein vBYenSP400_18 [Yersinia phage vB_YenS_P400]|nr:hypothetical protein vBYenSP400_18 [Yersinia phage vB_YenS_P400]